MVGFGLPFGVATTPENGAVHTSAGICSPERGVRIRGAAPSGFSQSETTAPRQTSLDSINLGQTGIDWVDLVSAQR